MTRAEFSKLAEQKVLLLDGATGSNLYKAGMPRGVCPEAWICEHPQTILDLQRAYIEAGSQIIYTPTFGANRIALAMHGMEHRAKELCSRLVSLSCKASDGRAFVAGDMTTTGKPVDAAGGISYAELQEVYCEQAQNLLDGGVDLFVVETMMGVTETAAAIEAIRAVCDLPILCSLSVQADGKAYFDGTLAEAAQTAQALGADAFGINCAFGPDQMQSLVKTVRENCALPIIAKPNAGMPEITEQGEAVYSMDDDAFASAMKPLMKAGAGLVGGCCGTTPAHIRKLKEIL